MKERKEVEEGRRSEDGRNTGREEWRDEGWNEEGNTDKKNYFIQKIAL